MFVDHNVLIFCPFELVHVISNARTVIFSTTASSDMRLPLIIAVAAAYTNQRYKYPVFSKVSCILLFL